MSERGGPPVPSSDDRDLLRIQDEVDRLEDSASGSWLNLVLLVLMAIFCLVGLGLASASLIMGGPSDVLVLGLIIGGGFGGILLYGGRGYLRTLRRIRSLERKASRIAGEDSVALQRRPRWSLALLPRESITKWSGAVLGGAALYLWGTIDPIQPLVVLTAVVLGHHLWSRYSEDTEPPTRDP